MTKLNLPKVILGTSCLGNLYTALPYEVKYAIVSEYINSTKTDGIAFFDTAGKYGAGLALECLGECLSDLDIAPSSVCISNKLGWLRTPLTGPEPTFEPGVWKELAYDSVQKISYDGILQCYEQGNVLLKNHQASFVSVHDPDEYLAAAGGKKEQEKRYQDIIEAYLALHELKSSGKVQAIGVGAKDWRVIEIIAQDVKLDWIMIANSMTIHSHPKALIDFIKKMELNGTYVINSAVFNAGFLTGGDYYNYKFIDRASQEGKSLYHWREDFYKVCASYKLSPAAVCVKFGLAAPGINSVALSTTSPQRVHQNLDLIHTHIPDGFWRQLYQENLISAEGLDLMFSSSTKN